jgi:hypothetical protein
VSRRPTSLPAAVALALSVIVPGLGPAAAAAAKAPPRPSPAVRAATALARRGLLRRSDLGAGFSTATAAPTTADGLTCTVDRATLASVASATWSQAAGTFASGTSYGFATATTQRQAWAETANAAMGPCLERRLQQGSSHGVSLRATGVRRLPGPRLAAGLSRVGVRRYEVTGTASGAGQDTPVTLDVLLVGEGAWIAEDEFTAADAPLSTALEARVAAQEARRIVRGT